jgi:hypothetical protein
MQLASLFCFCSLGPYAMVADRLQMNASIHHSVPSITQRAIRDFGARMVNDCKVEIIQHFNAQMIDQVSDQLLGIASEAFLDKCLAARLQTIEATPLINALAKAERLGFEAGDIVDQDVPQAPKMLISRLPVAAPPERFQDHCPKCGKGFVSTGGLKYVCCPPTPNSRPLSKGDGWY